MKPDTILVETPQKEGVPLVYSLPHSGRWIPEGGALTLEPDELIEFEDRHVDRLVAGASRLGAHVVTAQFHRAYIDPNRAPNDTVPEHVADDWLHPHEPTSLSERGIGLVFRQLASGRSFYDDPLSSDDLRSRLDGCWWPFHRAVAGALVEAAHGGRVWHVDWHAMWPVGGALAPDPGTRRADFVVSDLNGASATRAFTDFATRSLRDLGYSVAINEPFQGGYILRRYGRPALGRQSLQIEINRGLYLTPDGRDPSDGFEPLRDDLGTVSAALADYAARGGD